MTVIEKKRKQSMRQTVDEHSPTYRRAVEAIGKLVLEAGVMKPVPGEPVKFFRGARVKAK
jgi:hypothetical protein